MGGVVVIYLDNLENIWYHVNMTREEFATQLRERRRQCGYSLAQIHRNSGPRPSTLSRMERISDGYWPDISSLEKVAAAMNKKLDIRVIWKDKGTSLYEFIQRVVEERKENKQNRPDFAVDKGIEYYKLVRFEEGDIRNLGTLNQIAEKLGAKLFVVYKDE